MLAIIFGYFLGAILLVAVILSWLLTLATFATYLGEFVLVRRRVILWAANLDVLPPDTVLAMFFLPTVSATAAAFSGVGINLATSGKGSEYVVYGLALAFCSVIIVLVVGLSALNLIAKQERIPHWARRFLEKCVREVRENSLTASDLATRRRRAARLIKVGARLQERADDLTLSTWAHATRGNLHIYRQCKLSLYVDLVFLTLIPLAIPVDAISDVILLMMSAFDMLAITMVLWSLWLPVATWRRIHFVAGADLIERASRAVYYLERCKPAQERSRMYRAIAVLMTGR